MVPIAPKSWRTYSDVADVFHGPADAQWATDRERVDDALREPWSPQ